MSEDEAKALGAKPTDNADMLQLPFKWMEADWTCVVQFQEGKAVAVILYANMSDPPSRGCSTTCAPRIVCR